MNKKSVLVFLKEYSIITLGILMYVMAWVLFLIPNNLVGGGVSGIASIVQYATHGVVKIGTVYFGVNAILLIIGMMTLGKGFGGKTIYAVIVASVGLNVLQGVVPSEITQILAIENGKLICTDLAILNRVLLDFMD